MMRARRPRSALARVRDRLRAVAKMRRQSNDELARARERARQYLDIVGVAVVVIDADQRVSLVNRRGRELLGYPEDRIVGRNWFDAFVPAAEREVTRAGFLQLMAGESVKLREFENSVLTARGEERRVAWRNTVIRDDRGAIIGTLSSGEDITARRTAEKEREHFQAILENTLDYVGIADAQGTLLYLNEAARKLIGLPPGRDIRSTTIADCYWHEDAEQIVAEAYARLKDAGSWTGEVTWRGRDGLEVPTLMTAFAHKDASGQVEYCSMIAHDLRAFESDLHALNRTLEKRVAQRTAHLRAAHEKLREEKRRTQRYLDVAGVALVALDLEGRITMINRCGCALLEDEEENILGKNMFDEFLTGEERDYWSAFYANVIAGKQEHLEDGDVWLRTHAGNKRLIAWHSALLRDDDGNLIGVIGSGEDITDRQEAKEALQSSEAQLRVISDSLPVLISQIDSECRYQFNNAAYESFFGISRETLKGTHIRHLIGEQTFANCLPHIHDAFAGHPSVFELQFFDKEGLPRDATVHLVPDRAPDGEVVGFYAVITDITERKQLESALRQSQKMEAVGLLAGGISHDFNNLLMGIGGCCNVALERLEADSPVRIFLDEIRSAAASGASISRQLVDLSGQSKGEVANACLDALVADVESMLRRLLGANIQLRFDLQAGSARSHFGRGQFKQVLLNLVVNARDALLEDGTIDIETRVVELGADQARRFGGLEAGSYLTMTVRDNGMGMDSETAERIFEPFFTTKEVGRGSGLGLFTVYSIIAQHGGHIDVKSAPGRGTTFTVYLPRAEDDTEREEAAEVRGRRGNETVLVVEDDRLVQLALREYLGRWGYHVIEASDGNEAVQVAREYQGPIPLLISDMVLPGMPGSKVARAVLEIHPEAKVIYMSAHSPAMLAEAGHLERGTETLQKPFGEGELLERVSQVLGAPTHVPPIA